MLVHPAGNVSFGEAAKRYREALTDDSTFATMTLEDLLDTHALHESSTEEKFRERYLPWDPPKRCGATASNDCAAEARARAAM